MELVVAAAHIIGALIVQGALGLLMLILIRWSDSIEESAVQNAMIIDLDIDPNAPPDEKNVASIKKWLGARYSSELLRNRLSDVCGVLRMAWDAIGLLAMAAVYCGVLWNTIVSDMSNAYYAWLIIPTWLFFVITSILFAVICKVATGRYPGQARRVRKGLSKITLA